MNKPNILFILTDQQRLDTLGAYGCKVVPTPNLDRLAAEGICFEHAYVNNPLCTPSRACIWSGKPLPGHGVYRLHDLMSESQPLFPHFLKAQGYKTGLFGKMHISGRSYEQDNRHPLDGLDVYESTTGPSAYGGYYSAYGDWVKERDPKFFKTLREKKQETGHFPEELHFSRWATERATAFIEEIPEDVPFFCCISLFDPHEPYDDHPETMLEQVDEKALEEMFSEDVISETYPAPVRRERESGYLGAVKDYSEEQLWRIRRGYFASIAFMDRELQKVFASLERKNIKENTLVVFTSDHGDMLGQKGLLGKGGFFYDPCTRVPLIIKPPEDQKNQPQRSRFPAQPSDLAATFLRAAGLSGEWLGEELPDSRDLLDPKYREPDDDSFAICMYRNSGINRKKLYWDPPIHGTMIRNRRYKLNLYHNETDTPESPAGEFFDMEKDPLERVNLWHEKEFAEEIKNLKRQMCDWFANLDCRQNMGRSGSMFPPSSQWNKNNPIRL